MSAVEWEGSQYVQVGFHGIRRGGIDKDDFLRTRGHLHNTETATTSETLDDMDGTVVLSSKVSAVTLPAPRKGLRRQIVAITSATAARVVSLASGAFETTAISTAGARFDIATFNARGDFLDLIGISTALYFVREQVGLTLTTST